MSDTKPVDETQLLPCPFCGGSATTGMFNVWCDKCSAATIADTFASKEQIIAAWNTRVPSSVKVDAENECLMADCHDPQEHFCFKHCMEVYSSDG